MFKTIDDLVSLAVRENLPISKVMLMHEMEQTGQSEEALRDSMRRSLEVM